MILRSLALAMSTKIRSSYFLALHESSCIFQNILLEDSISMDICANDRGCKVQEEIRGNDVLFVVHERRILWSGKCELGRTFSTCHVASAMNDCGSCIQACFPPLFLDDLGSILMRTCGPGKRHPRNMHSLYGSGTIQVPYRRNGKMVFERDFRFESFHAHNAQYGLNATSVAICSRLDEKNVFTLW